MLENAGLIYQEADPDDKRKLLIYPTLSLTISDETKNELKEDHLLKQQPEGNSE